MIGDNSGRPDPLAEPELPRDVIVIRDGQLAGVVCGAPRRIVQFDFITADDIRLVERFPIVDPDLVKRLLAGVSWGELHPFATLAPERLEPKLPPRRPPAPLQELLNLRSFPEPGALVLMAPARARITCLISTPGRVAAVIYDGDRVTVRYIRAPCVRQTVLETLHATKPRRKLHWWTYEALDHYGDELAQLLKAEWGPWDPWRHPKRKVWGPLRSTIRNWEKGLQD
jgi:hypothetical protein